MDEADKLCDRIAIVDHGELKALDSPMKLKASVPGRNVLEVSFSADAGRLDARRLSGCLTSRRSPARITCSASPRATGRRRRWR